MRPLALIAPSLLGAALLAAPIGSSAFAQSRLSWNGTWAGGWSEGTGAQIIFADNVLVGFYWGDDYLEDAEGSVSPDGATARIRWPRGEAVLTREGDARARATVSERGRSAVTFELKRD